MAIEFGETVEGAKANIQCVVTQSKKPSTRKATIRANYNKAITA
jgi:hypothetical protein